MKIVEINAMIEGSTGRIMLQIADRARKNNMDVVSYSTNWSGKYYKKLQPAPEGHKYYSTYVENYIHLALGMATGFQNCFGHFNTWRLLKQINQFKPDIIHLHNLHSSYINLKMLFRYIEKNNIKVIWTLHDCWSFTGQCPHFTAVKCEKWKDGCSHCIQYKNYPKSYVDQTKKMWQLKKKWFNLPREMVIVTPSLWLSKLVKQSYLKKYPVKVINNGINLEIFKPTESDFREKYNLNDKKIVLGVSFSWGYRKGLDVFTELSTQLDSQYQIVLVGITEEIERKLPNNIIAIRHTESQKELAEIYSAADVFINPTREENYPTVNMEAIASGTPVITFDTGGSAEMLNSKCGIVVNCNDVEAMKNQIENVCCNKIFTEEECVKQAKIFNMNDKFEQYIDLYKKIVMR